MKFRESVAVIAGILLYFLLFNSSHARAITIDDLTKSQDISAIGAGASTSTGVSDASIIGGARSARIEVASTAGPSAKTDLEIVFGNLYYSETSSTGSAEIVWDGNANPSSIDYDGLGGIDLTEDSSNSLRFEVSFYDGGSPQSNLAQATFYIYDASDPTGATYSFASSDILITASAEIYEIPFSIFTAVGAGADFSNVGAIRMVIDDSAGASAADDIVVSYIGTNGLCPDIIPQSASAIIRDECGVCGGDNSSCAGCDGVPNSGLVFDACGQCGGDGSSCAGCDGIPNSGLVFDQCGICGGDNSQCKGCDGVPNSGLTIDICGICGGNGSSCSNCPGLIDVCGVCNGDGSSCLDCKGIPFGAAEVDKCGICAGDGENCYQCTESDQFELLAELDGGAKEQEFLIRGATNILRQATKDEGVNFASFIGKTKEKAHTLQITNWTISWQLPIIATTCANVTFCQTLSNEDKLTTYRTNSKKLQKLGLKSLKKARPYADNNQLGQIQSYRALIKERHAHNMALADSVQADTDICE